MAGSLLRQIVTAVDLGDEERTKTWLLSFMRAALGVTKRQCSTQTVRSRGICAKERRRACRLLRAASNLPAYELSMANNETSSDLVRTEVFSKIDFR
jgi:hypothetical protein